MIVPRSNWNARPPRSSTMIPLPAPRVWLHHTAGNEANGAAGMKAIQNFHMDGRGWADIGYSFVVDRVGGVYEGRGAGVQGAHTEGDNSRSHGICVIGNYESSMPPGATVSALRWLLRHGADQGWWPTPKFTGGHRNAPGASTACPGARLYAELGAINAPIPKEDEMVYIRKQGAPSGAVYRVAGAILEHVSGEEWALLDPKPEVRVVGPDDPLYLRPKLLNAYFDPQ